MVSPATERPKSGIDAAALKTGPASEKSSALMSGLIPRLSMTLASEPTDAITASSKALLAFSSGKSPRSVMSLPLRVIDTGANDIGGMVGAGGEAPADVGGPASAMRRWV